MGKFREKLKKTGTYGKYTNLKTEVLFTETLAEICSNYPFRCTSHVLSHEQFIFNLNTL